MNIHNVISAIKNGQFKNKTVEKIRHILRIKDYSDEINTLYYFVNNIVDVSALPKATGSLRELQLCDTQLIRIFDAVCKEHGWDYWLDFGTLLGAVRHSGFIPWDDDVDVSMLREDYNEALKILPDIMSSYGIDVSIDNNELLKRIGLGYKHSLTGVWIDVFPVDSFYSNDSIDQIADYLPKRLDEYKKLYKKKFYKWPKDKILDLKESIINSQESSRDFNHYVYHCPEFDFLRYYIFDINDIFPVKKMCFEGYEFNVPNHTDRYLSKVFGNNYMSLPKSGVEHHGDIKGNISEWSKVSNIDMCDVENTLRGIADNAIREN